MSSIMGQIKPEHTELFALEFGKIAKTDFVYTIHAICPELSETVSDFDTLSWRPGNNEIVPEIPKIKSTDFLRPIERERFVINSCLNDKCCICCPVPIISGIPVVIDRH